jgi:CheY-like chemotaxis protein
MPQCLPHDVAVVSQTAPQSLQDRANCQPSGTPRTENGASGSWWTLAGINWSPVGRDGRGAMPVILIVDDDPEICVLLSQVLGDAGYTVETAPDSLTALKMIAASPPDLLITDVLMPGLTGWSLFARVRRLSPRLPIIVISGTDMGVPRQETSLAEHAVFLRKPFDLDQLLAIVERLLAGTRSEST